MSAGRSYHSPFKINLGLEVLSKRTDGYHEINTIFYRFDEPHDTLTVRTDAPSFTFSTSDSDLPTDERNLVVRAISACAEFQDKDMPAIEIRLDKVIPSGAGLGGGSANAATAIKIYSELVSPLSAAEQLEIGASLGADVPFFLNTSRAARASGIGATLEPFDLHFDYPCLVVKPAHLHASTTESYAGLKISGSKKNTDLRKLILTTDPRTWAGKIVNDFEPLVFQRFPELEGIRNTFLQHNALFALMSGSGSASYGLFANLAAAEKARDHFRNIYQDGFLAIAE